MAKIGVSLKIDVTKIDKARLFKGQKGTYLDATAFIELDQLDQYGNSGMITQDVSKQEKDSGVQGAILGNSKVFWSESGQAPQKQAAQGQQPQGNQPAKGFGQNNGQPAPAPGGQSFDDFDQDVPF